MEANKIRNIKQGKEFDYLFPKAKLTDSRIKRGASVNDTVNFIPKAVELTKWQTKKLAKMLKGGSLHDTCHNIWDFVFQHIRYHKDEEGREQIRSPARSWHDRFRGVDCDCYTMFISTILTNLRIPHILRITKYSGNNFQHIYPIVPVANGKEIIIDCVVEKFNYEEPYTEKKDTPMDLEFLEGLESTDAELGKGGGWFKKFSHDYLHALNKFNPATVALRNGLLVCMKLNLFKVAQRLKYAYMTEEQAKSKDVDIDKWHKLIQIKDKIENIYYGAGGIPSNFKKAMLTGEGNKKHDVSGLGYAREENISNMDKDMPLRKILGEAMWKSENESVGSLGSLGDPVTGTSVAAASGIMGIIATIIKTVGSIFPKSAPASADFATTKKDDAAASDAASKASADDKKKYDDSPDKPNHDGDDSDVNSKDGDDKKGFWNKNKKWLKPTLITLGGLGALFGGYKFVTGGEKEKKKEGLSGSKKHKGNKKPVSLL